MGSLLALTPAAFSQTKLIPATAGVARPRLVVGIVVDQMRWDYLYRFYNLYKAQGGFRRMLDQGFSCDNNFIPYTPTVTAAGHSCVYTGSVPAINGITGNEWYDRIQNRDVYCAEDKNVQLVGEGTADAGQMSPRNMLATTVTDELRIASNFKSKVIGIAIKDRGAIMPAGHSANGAYWYDGKSGNFITSSWYMNTLPAWVSAFNKRKVTDSLYKSGWNLSLNKEVYAQYCTEDIKEYENRPLGKEAAGFPYLLSQFAGKDYSKISSTPHGNTLTAEMAKAAVAAEQLGKGAYTDFLAISFSSPDILGHAFGPNSWEQLDDYIKLDETLGNLFDYLDTQVGKGQYTVFLTADHGVAHVAGFSKENKLPGGVSGSAAVLKNLHASLKNKFGADHILLDDVSNWQLILNKKVIDSAQLNTTVVKEFIIDFLLQQDAIAQAFDLKNISGTTLPAVLKLRVAEGYYPTRCGDIQMIMKPGYLDGAKGTSHGLWNPYDSHIPLVWYGWGIKKGNSQKENYMTDIAPTVAALLHIQMPSGSVGQVIEEVIKK